MPVTDSNLAFSREIVQEGLRRRSEEAALETTRTGTSRVVARLAMGRAARSTRKSKKDQMWWLDVESSGYTSPGMCYWLAACETS